MIYLLIYFVAGIIQDFVLTLNWQFVARHKPLPATFFSFLATFFSWVIFYDVLTRLDGDRSLVAIIVYSLGIGVGTYLAMKSGIGAEKK